VNVAVVTQRLFSKTNAKVARVFEVQANLVASFRSALTVLVVTNPVGESFFGTIPSGESQETSTTENSPGQTILLGDHKSTVAPRAVMNKPHTHD
jgi:hypothetical protein